MECLPQITLIKGYGSSETGNMGFGHSQRRARRATLSCSGKAARSSRRTAAGSCSPASPRSAGWPGPAGFRWDISMMPTPPERTFPEIEGQRVVISGDRASVETDGTMRLFGRDSLVVNTGGEKVFVEEVEEVLRAHPAIADALVVGRPSERWGEEVVALVALRAGPERSPATSCTPLHVAAGTFQSAQGVHLRRADSASGQR